MADRGGRAFALPLITVVRVTPSPRICEAPLLPDGYVGVIEFAEQAVPVWDPFPDAGDFLWGATVIVAQSANGGLLGFLSDAPPKVATNGEVVPPEELAAAAAPPAPASPAEEEDVDWSVGPSKPKAAAAPAGPPVLPSGAMWDKVVRFGGHPVPVVDPMRFALEEKPETRPAP